MWVMWQDILVFLPLALCFPHDGLLAVRFLFVLGRCYGIN